jgi:hypothetical protein
MREAGVFDADLHNKRLQVNGLFGPVSTKVCALDPPPNTKSVHVPDLHAWRLHLPTASTGLRCVAQAPEARLCAPAAVLRGMLLAVHAAAFLALVARSTASFAVLVHATAITFTPMLLVAVDDAWARTTALSVHLAGVASLVHRTPALDAELLSPAFYALFGALLLARIAAKATSPSACVSRMCIVFYVLYTAALLAVVALFAVRETVAKDPRDQAALDLTATVTAGIVLACHVLF